MTGWAARRGPGGRRCFPMLSWLTLAVAQALLGIRSEARWLRFVPAHLPGAFPYLPGQSGYNKRLRAALPLLARAIRVLAQDTDLWDDLAWIVDSTPVECARSRPAVRRSELAGWAAYGYCPSHSRFFWGLRLHLVCTPAGLPVTWALASPKLDERQILRAILERDPGPGQRPPGPGDHRRQRLRLQGPGPLAHPARRNHPAAHLPQPAHRARASTCSNPSASSSNRSTTPSKASWTWNCTAGAPSKASAPASPSASWP